jgi:hypothetical protein
MAKISAIVSMGSIKPVDSFAGIMEAARMGIRMPMPGIPAFVKPIKRAHMIITAHPINEKLYIRYCLPLWISLLKGRIKQVHLFGQFFFYALAKGLK